MDQIRIYFKKIFFNVCCGPRWNCDSLYQVFSLGVDQLPMAMRGPLGLLCFFTRTTPGGSKNLYTCSLWEKWETVWPFHGHKIPTSSRTIFIKCFFFDDNFYRPLTGFQAGEGFRGWKRSCGRQNGPGYWGYSWAPIRFQGQRPSPHHPQNIFSSDLHWSKKWSNLICQGLISAHGLRNWNPDWGDKLQLFLWLLSILVCSLSHIIGISSQTDSFLGSTGHNEHNGHLPANKKFWIHDYFCIL